jgi:hypothetical protein
VSYLDELARELRAVGIRGPLARRILREARDHLAESRSPDEFGAPAELAARFADDLAPAVARRGAFTSFATLAVAGIVFFAAFLLVAPSTILAGRQTLLGTLALGAATVAGQVAFAAGSLALLRALRRPRDVRIVARRALVGVGSGVVTLAALAVVAYAYRAKTPAWWETYVYVAGGVSALALVASLPRVATGLVLRPTGVTTQGDLRDDLPLGADTWRLARGVALAVGALVAFAGIIQGDPFDGLIRGALEGLACFGGFVLLGPFLGLRR